MKGRCPSSPRPLTRVFVETTLTKYLTDPIPTRHDLALTNQAVGSPVIHPAMGTGDPVEDFPSILPHRRPRVRWDPVEGADYRATRQDLEHQIDASETSGRDLPKIAGMTEPQKAFLNSDGSTIWRREKNSGPTSPTSNASPANKQLSPDVQRLICLIQERPLVGELILALLRWIGSASLNASEIWAWKAGAILNRCSPGWDEDLPWHQQDIPDRLKVGWEWVSKRGGR